MSPVGALERAEAQRGARVAYWLAATACALGPAPAALACAVCGGGGRNAGAYLDMTIFLSLLPLSIIGGLAFAVWRISRVG